MTTDTDTEGFYTAPPPTYRLGAVTGEAMRAALEEAEEPCSPEAKAPVKLPWWFGTEA